MNIENRLNDRAYLLELFAFVNLAFLALDIYVAHRVNAFAHRAEWIPFIFSIIGPLVLLPGLFDGKPDGRGRIPGLLVGVLAITVGLVGLFFHLESHFFQAQSLASLVYTAPFVAPLAYTGVGFLLLLNRMVEVQTREWARWVILLALGGFLGNFLLSVCDHAQNGFFHQTEWIPVVSSAFGVSFLTMLCAMPGDRRLGVATLWVMLLQVLVGLIGFGLHLSANLGGTSNTFDNFVYGAPIFAPLLFINLSLLAVLGVWSLRQAS